jgi:hypothetical protein
LKLEIGVQIERSMFYYSTQKKLFVITLASLLTVLVYSMFFLPNASAGSTLGSAAAAKGRIFGAAVTGSLLSGSQYSNLLSLCLDKIISMGYKTFKEEV